MKIGIRIEHFVPGSELHAMLPYTEIRAYVLEVEKGGLDSIWVSDHMMYRFNPEFTAGPWECWTLLSALAEVTNRVELRTCVVQPLPESCAIG